MAGGSAFEQTLSHVESLGYLLSRFDTRSGQLRPLNSSERVPRPTRVANVIAVPDLDAAQRRLDTSPLRSEPSPPVRVEMNLERR